MGRAEANFTRRRERRKQAGQLNKVRKMRIEGETNIKNVKHVDSGCRRDSECVLRARDNSRSDRKERKTDSENKAYRNLGGTKLN